MTTTEAPTRTIDPAEAEDLFCKRDGQDVGAWCREADLYDDKSRWLEHRTLVLRHDDDTVWGLPYSRGLTECQESEFPWRDADGPLPLVQLWRIEEIRVRYVTEEPDRTAPDHLTDRIYDTLMEHLGRHNLIQCAVTETGPANGIEAADVEGIATNVAQAVRELTR